MSVPIVNSISPTTGAIFGAGLITIHGSGFFGGTSAFNVSNVVINGLKAGIVNGGTDTSFKINSPVFTPSPSNIGSFNIIVTTSIGVSSGGPLYTYTMFPAGQDRSLDYKTAQFWCYGCPFLNVISHPRNAVANVEGNWNSVQPSYANTTKTHYFCGSPKANFKQEISQEASLIGVSFCPYFQDKWNTLYNASESF